MKKIIIIAVFVMCLALMYGQTNTPRTLYVHVVNQNLSTIPNGNGLTFTATSTGSSNTLTHLSTGCGFQVTTVPTGVVQTHAKIQLGNFINQWVTGDQITLTVTRISDNATGTITVTIPDNGTTSIWWGRLPNPPTTYPGSPLVLVAPGFNLNVTSTPAGATIIKDGTPTAFTTPHTFFPGEAGTYTLAPMAGYTAWTPVQYVVPALTIDTTIDFQATLIPPDTYALTVNAVGPSSIIYKDGVTTGQVTPFTFNGATAAALTGIYTLEPLGAGLYWDPASITVVAGDFTSGKGMGSRSNGAKTAYAHTITFTQMAYPTYTLNVNGPDGYAVTGPVNGTTDYVATDNNNMVNDLLGQYTIAAAPAGYVWAVNPITVSETNFTANMATIEFVLNEIPIVVTPAAEGDMPAGYPTTAPPTAFYIVTGAGVHDLFIPQNPGETAAYAYIGGVWVPASAPNWTWLAVDFGVKAPVPVIVLGPTLPVELSSFSAILTAQNFVKLTWVTESETNMNGYNVFRNETADYSAATHIGYTASTNSSTQHVYSLTDNEVETNNTYYYWLECVDFNGTSTLYGPQYVTVVGNDVPNLPTATALKNAYPNPFKTNTTIAVDVKEGENATVTIYNILGQAVMTYRVPAGSHNLNWNGRDSKGNNCGSGIYFYKLSSPTMNQTKKMVIVK